MKVKILIVAILAIGAAIILWALFFRAPKASEPAPEYNTEEVEEAPIKLFEPAADAAVSSPLALSGEARGTWYFEASFPVRMLDANGRELGVTPVQAQSEWMTEDYVPFRGTIEFEMPATETGTLVLEKDNPSGLPENAAEMYVPIRFSQTAEAMVVKVFFGNSALDPETMDCGNVFGAERTIPKTQASARAALEELFAGPTRAEMAEGYFTSINSGVTIQRLVIENKIARADLSPRLDEDMGGSCRVTAIRSQIAETLKQFPTVDDVVISIDGETNLILQP